MKELLKISITLYKATLPLAALALFSCTFNGSFQGLRSYYPEAVSENPNLFVHLGSGDLICETKLAFKNKVVISTANNLKECLQSDSSIVYIWGAKCKSAECKSLNESQELADQKDVNLFIVAEYYDAVLMDLNYQISYPIVGIDTEYYNSEWTKTYLTKFLTELTGEITEHSVGRFLVFVDGKISGRYRTMEEAVRVSQI